MHPENPSASVAPTHEDPNQFALLRQRRFAPFFWTQFSGAANDNLFKFAFTVMVTYQLSVAWLLPAMAGLVIGALFILPFLMFSATSGQLTDKLPKTLVIRFVKNLEIAIMALAAVGFLAGNVALQVPLLLACTFLMGLHSTLFGPVKFAYLPQVLHERVVEAAAERREGLCGVAVGGFYPDVAHAKPRRQGREQWTQAIFARQPLELADHRQRLAREDQPRPAEQAQQRVGRALLREHEFGEACVALGARESGHAGLGRRRVEFLRRLAFETGATVDDHAARKRCTGQWRGHG